LSALTLLKEIYLKRQDGEVQTETIVNNGEKISLTEGKVYQVNVHWNFGETVNSSTWFLQQFSAASVYGSQI
jgi:hypothetical protein